MLVSSEQVSNVSQTLALASVVRCFVAYRLLLRKISLLWQTAMYKSEKQSPQWLSLLLLYISFTLATSLQFPAVTITARCRVGTICSGKESRTTSKVSRAEVN